MSKPKSSAKYDLQVASDRTWLLINVLKAFDKQLPPPDKTIADIEGLRKSRIREVLIKYLDGGQEKKDLLLMAMSTASPEYIVALAHQAVFGGPEPDFHQPNKAAGDGNVLLRAFLVGTMAIDPGAVSYSRSQRPSLAFKVSDAAALTKH